MTLYSTHKKKAAFFIAVLQPNIQLQKAPVPNSHCLSPASQFSLLSIPFIVQIKTDS